jgi:DNA adenine methylase
LGGQQEAALGPTGALRYIEPFAGSAAFFFDVEPERAILSDSNKTLVEFYNTVRVHADLVYELASSWAIDKDTYYSVRGSFKTESDAVRRSAMFFYLNRNCFNGIFRTNMKGEFNVPHAATKSGAMPSWEEVQDAVRLLRRSQVSVTDFRKIVNYKVDAGDFIYLDPPYAVENRRVFVQYNAQTFGISDLEELSYSLHCLDALGAKFVLSYAVSSEALHYFRHWIPRRVACQRHVAGFSGHRKKAMELLVSNIQLT